MDSEIVKGKPLSKDESKYLVDLIEKSKIITTKTTNATNNKLKNEEWIRLAERFNATATNCRRTPQQLRLKWENLKKNSRKRSTKIRMNQIKTGGGPADYIPPDDILDRVTSLLGSTVSGFTVPFGGDREPSGFVLGGGDIGGGDIGDGIISDGIISDARVSVVTKEDSAFMPLVDDHGIETVVDGAGGGVGSSGSIVCDNEVLEVIDENISKPKTKRVTFSTPRAAKKKIKSDENRTSRNIAIAEYFSAKKECIYAKLNSINIENESLKLRNIELKLTNEKLLVEIEKLKLETKLLKEQV